MDLVSFIPGILNSALFSPGPSTPAPYNGNHTGLVDGSFPDQASANVAQIYNRILLQIASCIDFSGIGVDNTNWAQLGLAVKAIAQSVVDSSLSGGVVTTPQYNADFAFSHGVTGYQYIKGGLMLQWGQTNAPGTFPSFFTTTFPITFPNAVYQVIGTVSNTASFSTKVLECDVRLSSKSTSSATWFNTWVGDGSSGPESGGFSPTLFWFAIGK